MLLAQSFLFKVDQLAQRHFQDRVGLHAGKVVIGGLAPFVLEDVETFFAQRTLHHGCGALDAHQADLGFGLSLTRTDDANDFIDVGQRQQQTFDGVLLLSGSSQQKLSPAADDGNPVAKELG